MITGLRRSSLYVPGDSLRMIFKAQSLPADVLLLNLEDGVSESKKDEARQNVIEAVRNLDFGQRETVVRVNGFHTETGSKDLACVVSVKPDAICLPKVESAEEVRVVDSEVSEMEAACGVSVGSIRIYAMIESARGILNAASIAAASNRMAALVFGSADYVKDMRCRPGDDRSEMLLALQHIVLAARACGIDALDGPCFDLRNPELLRKEASQARRLGFDGKNALHPDQLETINEIFDVTLEEIAWAQRVVAELAQAEQRGRALATFDGRLIDNPHQAAAQRILTRASLAGKV